VDLAAIAKVHRCFSALLFKRSFLPGSDLF
jgi:hypothetical protein